MGHNQKDRLDTQR